MKYYDNKKGNVNRWEMVINKCCGLKLFQLTVTYKYYLLMSLNKRLCHLAPDILPQGYNSLRNSPKVKIIFTEVKESVVKKGFCL